MSSSKILTVGHFGVFKRMPKVIPTPFKIDMKEFLNDIDNWKNRLRWAIHHNLRLDTPDLDESYKDMEHFNIDKNMEQDLIKNHIPYVAPIGKNHALEFFFEKVEDDLKKCKEKTYAGDNLSNEERDALKDMMKWDYAIIRPFDKTSGFMIVDKEKYVESVKEVLNDTTKYEIVDPTVVQDINNKISTWAIDWEYANNISSKIAKGIVRWDSKPGYFYQTYTSHLTTHLEQLHLYADQ